MIETYKRFVLWNCRLMSKIPGLKRYGKFMERHYTEHFWRTWAINCALSIAQALVWRKLVNKLQEEVYTGRIDPKFDSPQKREAVFN